MCLLQLCLRSRTSGWSARKRPAWEGRARRTRWAGRLRSSGGRSRTRRRRSPTWPSGRGSWPTRTKSSGRRIKGSGNQPSGENCWQSIAINLHVMNCRDSFERHCELSYTSIILHHMSRRKKRNLNLNLIAAMAPSYSQIFTSFPFSQLSAWRKTQWLVETEFFFILKVVRKESKWKLEFILRIWQIFFLEAHRTI